MLTSAMTTSKVAAFYGNRLHIGSLPIVRPHGAINKSADLRVNKKLEKRSPERNSDETQRTGENYSLKMKRKINNFYNT